MTRKRIGRVIERKRKNELGTQRSPYPQNMEFLSTLPFYSIVKVIPPDSSKVVTRIEFSINKARYLFDEMRCLAELEKSSADLKVKYDALLEEKVALEKKYNAVKHNLDTIILNQENDKINEDSNGDISLRSTMFDIENASTNTRPYQGGGTGLKGNK